MDSETEGTTTSIARLGTVSYVIAGLLFGSYLLYLIFDANEMLPGEAFTISSIDQFILLLVISVFASIGIYIDERGGNWLS